MKKYVWLMVAAALTIAVLAMVGCRPAETPAPSPTPTPTPTPPVDRNCPKVKSVVVSNVYGDEFRDESGGASFTVTLTFDEDIEGKWSCLLDETNWTVTVSNATRIDEEIKAEVEEVTKVDDNEIKITARVQEGSYYGLICDEEDAATYAEAFDLDDAPSFADTVKVELDNDCIIYDKLGNACCGLKVEGCCTVTCAVTVPTGCPL